MKKFLSAVLVGAMLMFTGCSSANNSEGVPSDNSSSSVSMSSSKSSGSSASPSSSTSPSSSKSSSSSVSSSASASSSSSTSSTSDPQSKTVTPPFFKITDEKTGGVAYLFGSMHTLPEGVDLPSEIYAAIDSSDTLAVEVDTQALAEGDPNVLLAAMMNIVLQDGTTTADHLGEDYDKVLEYFKEKGLYIAGLEYYYPTMWNNLLANYVYMECGFSPDRGIEDIVLTYAKGKSKKIDEIETAESQYKMMASEPMDLQVYSLKQTIEMDMEELKAQTMELYRAWSTNDKEFLESAFMEVPEGFEEEYKEYYRLMYTDRQKNMAAYIEDKLSKGEKVFVAVGAAHCYASPDILDYLEGKAAIEEVKFAD